MTTTAGRGTRGARLAGVVWSAGGCCLALALVAISPARVWSEEAPAPLTAAPTGLAEREPVAGAAQSPSTGTRQALVLFARFANEGSATVPGWAAQIFAPDTPGSFSHYWDTMSFGQLRVRGAVAPRVYLSAHNVAAYLADDSTQVGQFGRFSLEVLLQADEDVDFAAFDNDGPDGAANSGDDDGIVDAVFLVIASAPANFLLGAATGIAGLGLEPGAGGPVSADPVLPNVFCYDTGDLGAGGKPIRISSRQGAIQQGRTLAVAVGSMCHEYGHLLGLPDLYDVSFLRTPGALPEQDSAGAGRWCLMGWGAFGWQDQDGPTSLCAWSRWRLGWVEALEPTQPEQQLAVPDVGLSATVWQVPLTSREQYLVEYRRHTSSWYDRHLPAEGLLVWHVERTVPGADGPPRWLVDLECADGRWADAGYPSGSNAAPVDGGDNLDYWAHDERYAAAHAGNLGDSTDVYDGVRYSRFTPDSNPAAVSGDGRRGIRLEGIALAGDTAHARLTVDPPVVVLEGLTASSRRVAAGTALPLVFGLTNSGGMRATGLTARLVVEDGAASGAPAEAALRDLDPDATLLPGAAYASQPLRLRFAPGLEREHTVHAVAQILAAGQVLDQGSLSVTGVPSALVTGTVTADTGQPLVGMRVVLWLSSSETARYDSEVATDGDGAFQAYVPPGRCLVSAGGPGTGWGQVEQQVLLTAGQGTRVRLELPRRHLVTGVVRDTQGQPVSDVGVWAWPADSLAGMPAAMSGTRTDGSYRLELPAGAFVLQSANHVNTGGWFPPQELARIQVESDRALDLVLDPGLALTVRILGEDGSPVAGVRAQVPLAGVSSTSYGPESTDLTDEQGTGVLHVLRGQRTLTVLDPPAPYLPVDPLSLDIQGDTTVVVTLRKGPGVTLRLVDAQGQPIQHRGAYLYVASTSSLVSLRLAGGQSTVAVALQPGHYSLSITFSSERDSRTNAWPDQDLGPIDIQGDQEVAVVLRGGVLLSGVVYGPDGAPLTGVYADLAFTAAQTAGGYQGGSAPVGGRGQYGVRLLPGEYEVSVTVSATGTGAPSQSLGSLRVEADMEQDFRLRGGVTVTVTVVDEAGSPLDDAAVSLQAQDTADATTTSVLSYRQLVAGTAAVAVTPGSYEVQLSPSSTSPFPSQVLGLLQVTADTAAQFVARRGVRVSGRVLDTSGRPRGGGTVNFLPLEGAVSGYAQVGVDGTFALRLFPGTYDVLASDGAGTVQGLGLVAVATDTTLGLTAELAEAVWGRVADAAGAGVPGLSLNASRIGPFASGRAVTDAGGAFALALVPGRYQIWATRDGADEPAYTSWNLGSFSVPASAAVALLLPSGATLTGQVTDAAGQPVRAVLALVRDPRRQDSDDNTVVYATTALDGAYEFAAAPGTYALVATRMGAAEGTVVEDAVSAVLAGIALEGRLTRNVVLPEAPMRHVLSGSVQRPGGAAVDLAYLRFYDESQGLACTATVSAGEYRVALPPGLYWVTTAVYGIAGTLASGPPAPGSAGWLAISQDRTWDLVIDESGTAVTDEQQVLPPAFSLGPAYPNPFNGQVIIPYTLPALDAAGSEAGARVFPGAELAIHDVLGQRVRVLTQQVQRTGSRQALWDGRDDAGRPVASGVYLCRLRLGQQQRVQRLALVR